MYRTIDTVIWDDPWFSEVSPDAKLLFLYFITNNRQTACGAFNILRRSIGMETGLASERVKAALEELAPKIVWWSEHQVVWVRNFYRWQRANAGPTFQTSGHKALRMLPEEVQAEVLTVYPELAAPAPPPAPKPPKGAPKPAVDTLSGTPDTLSENEDRVSPPYQGGYREGTDRVHAKTKQSKAELNEEEQPTVVADATAARSSLPRKTREPSENQAEHAAMFAALSKAFGAPTPGAEHGRYEAAARALRTAGAHPSEIPGLVERWSWVNPGPPRVNSLAGHLTVLRNAVPGARDGRARASPEARERATREAGAQWFAESEGIDLGQEKLRARTR